MKKSKCTCQTMRVLQPDGSLACPHGCDAHRKPGLRAIQTESRKKAQERVPGQRVGAYGKGRQ